MVTETQVAGPRTSRPWKLVSDLVVLATLLWVEFTVLGHIDVGMWALGGVMIVVGTLPLWAYSRLVDGKESRPLAGSDALPLALILVVTGIGSCLMVIVPVLVSGAEFKAPAIVPALAVGALVGGVVEEVQFRWFLVRRWSMDGQRPFWLSNGLGTLVFVAAHVVMRDMSQAAAWKCAYWAAFGCVQGVVFRKYNWSLLVVGGLHLGSSTEVLVARMGGGWLEVVGQAMVFALVLMVPAARTCWQGDGVLRRASPEDSDE